MSAPQTSPPPDPTPARILSAEQQAILAQPPDRTFRIIAFAGCAKTTTLIHYAHAWPGRALYLAFNQHVAADARTRFPPHVACRTAHAHAFHTLGMARHQNRIVPRLLPEHLDPLPLKLGSASETRRLQSQIIRTITRWCNSDEDEIQDHMVPDASEQRRAIIADITRDVLETLLNWEHGSLPITHDLYLKRLATRPKYSADLDYLLVDEAQDLNGAILQLVERSNTPVVFVGDPYQSIYAFRGARNVLDSIDAESLPLTRSWRFGPELAELANQILQWHGKPPTQSLKGNPDRTTKIRTYTGKVPRGALLLARTNARLFGGLLTNLMPYHMIGGAQDMLWQVETAFCLWRGRRPANPHPNLDRFPLWESLIQAAETESDPDASRMRSIIEQHGDQIPAALDVLRRLHRPNPAEAYYTVATVHKAKGLEWDEVVMLDDLHSPAILRNAMIQGRLSRADYDQEINLLYVAATRARQQLHLPAAVLECL